MFVRDSDALRRRFRIDAREHGRESQRSLCDFLAIRSCGILARWNLKGTFPDRAGLPSAVRNKVECLRHVLLFQG